MLRRSTATGYKYMPEFTESDHTDLRDLAKIVRKKAPKFSPDGSPSQVHCLSLTADLNQQAPSIDPIVLR